MNNLVLNVSVLPPTGMRKNWETYDKQYRPLSKLHSGALTQTFLSEYLWKMR